MRIWLSLFLIGMNCITGLAQSSDTPGPNSVPEAQEADIQAPLSDRDSLLIWQEKVMLHISSSDLRARERLFFKAYLTTGIRGTRFSQSKVLRVELVNESGEIFHKQYHPISDGLASGNFEIPKKIGEGKYFLKAYTQWMQNYGPQNYTSIPLTIGENKNLSDQSKNPKKAYRIVPEGGHFLSGYNNKLIVAVNDSNSRDFTDPMEIVDNQGNTVSLFTAYPGGLFVAGFTPEAGGHYKIRSSGDNFFSIPEAKNEGYLLQVNNLDPEKIKIRVTASPRFYNSNVRIAGEMEGIRITEREFNIGPSGLVEFDLSKTSFPGGIMMLRLLDKEDNPLAYRPVWLDKGEVNLETTDLKQVSPGEYTFEIKATDQNDQPLKTQLALGINSAETNDSFRPWVSDNLVSGSVEDFGFDSDSHNNRNKRFLEDLRLLGRAESIENGIGSKSFTEIKYPVQEGLDIYGYAYDMENKLLKERDIQLMVFSDDQVLALEIKTDSNGGLGIENLQLTGESQLVFRTKGGEEESSLVKVVPSNVLAENNSKSLEKEIKKNIKKRVFEPSTYQLQDTTGLIELEEVILEETAIEKKTSPSLYNVNPTRVVVQDPQRPKTIPQMLLGIPGVVVTGLGSLNPSVIVQRASGPVLWVIDGFPISTGGVTPGFINTVVADDAANGGFPGSSSSASVNQALPPSTASSSGTSALAEVMSIVSAYDVEKIELLFGPDAAIFGSRVASAVFLVYTRFGNNTERSMRNEAQLKYQGYQAEIGFEEYINELSKKDKKSIETIYWKPEIETDENGRAIISFSTANYKGPINVNISTVTKDGRIKVLSKELLLE